jgi:amino acid transporter
MSAKSFFANYSSVVAVVIIWIGAHMWYRCPLWVNASTINLDEFRRFYRDHDHEDCVPAKRSLLRKLKVIFE